VLSRNRYIYVKNNPLKYVDPSGEQEEEKNSDDGLFDWMYDIEFETTSNLDNGGFQLASVGSVFGKVVKFAGGRIIGVVGYGYDLFKPEMANASEEELLAQCGNSCFEPDPALFAAAGIVGGIYVNAPGEQKVKTPQNYSSEFTKKKVEVNGRMNHDAWVHNETGQVFVQTKGGQHGGPHYEVYKNKVNAQKGIRMMDVWEDSGKIKSLFNKGVRILRKVK